MIRGDIYQVKLIFILYKSAQVSSDRSPPPPLLAAAAVAAKAASNEPGLKEDNNMEVAAKAANSALEMAQFEYLRAMAMASVAQQQQQSSDGLAAAYRDLLVKQQQINQRKSMEDVLKKLAAKGNQSDANLDSPR